MQRIFQTILNLADPADPHALDPGNFFTDAENVISMNAPGLDRRELDDGCMEGGPDLHRSLEAAPGTAAGRACRPQSRDQCPWNARHDPACGVCSCHTGGHQ